MLLLELESEELIEEELPIDSSTSVVGWWAHILSCCTGAHEPIFARIEAGETVLRHVPRRQRWVTTDHDSTSWLRAEVGALKEQHLFA